MFYFRVKGTECLISRHHVIKYKSHWGENASKKGGMKGGGGGGGVQRWRWWCVNLHGVLQGRKLLC